MCGLVNEMSLYGERCSAVDRLWGCVRGEGATTLRDEKTKRRSAFLPGRPKARARPSRLAAPPFLFFRTRAPNAWVPPNARAPTLSLSSKERTTHRTTSLVSSCPGRLEENTAPLQQTCAFECCNRRKRARVEAGAMSVLAAAQAQLPLVKGDDGEIMTQQFLSVCKLVFPVIGAVFWFAASAAARSARVFVGARARRRPLFSGSRRQPLHSNNKQTSSGRPSPSSRWTLAATST